ncbi:MAG: hypothetical protein U0992_06765 [Planctomycetaceae bacterium]
MPQRTPGRLASLDAYRGFIMPMLAAGGFGISQFASIDAASPVWQIVNRDVWQRIGLLNHPEWRSNFLPTFLESAAAPDPPRPSATGGDSETPAAAVGDAETPAAPGRKQSC